MPSPYILIYKEYVFKTGGRYMFSCESSKVPKWISCPGWGPNRDSPVPVEAPELRTLREGGSVRRM